MPLYELFCLARPSMAKDELFKMIYKVGTAVYGRGGVVTDVASFGQQNLAYRISGVHGKYTQAQIWQLDFAASPETLKDIKYELRVNEDVLRWVVVKRKAVPPLPKPHAMIQAWVERNPEFATILPQGRREGFVLPNSSPSSSPSS